MKDKVFTFIEIYCMKYWLVKSEPETYAWYDLVEKREASWDGIRNFQARNFMKEMAVGDRVLFYHSGKERAVVGIAAVSKASYAEQGYENEWVVVDLKAGKGLKKPVTLAMIKQNDKLHQILLVKQSRLSVMPLPMEAFQEILNMSTT